MSRRVRVLQKLREDQNAHRKPGPNSRFVPITLPTRNTLPEAADTGIVPDEDADAEIDDLILNDPTKKS